MKRFLCLIILLIGMVFLYSKYVEPTSLKVNEFIIANTSIPKNFDGFKIAHFSDVLYTGEKDLDLLDKAILEINNSNADIVIFTGDLINKKPKEEETATLISKLSKIESRLYKYAILGDNDTDETKNILEQSNFIILDNTALYLFNEGPEPILIAGGDNLTEEVLLKDENINYNFKIALTHFPDNYDNIKSIFDLVFSGHSLGGELRIPYVGSIIKKDGANKYTDYLYNKDNKIMFVSFGLGSEKTNLRLLNKPSINVYRLLSQ